MSDYNKVVFVCKENLNQSPMAEWIFKSIVMDLSKEIASRGQVVLFPEPFSQKVADLLRKHSVPYEEKTSQLLMEEDFAEDTLIITMSAAEKIKVVEEFNVSQNVFTLYEFVEEEGEVIDPYGGEEAQYESCYNELKELLYKMKEKLDWR